MLTDDTLGVLLTESVQGVQKSFILKDYMQTSATFVPKSVQGVQTINEKRLSTS